MHDHLPMPNGRKVGDMSTPELNRVLERVLTVFDERAGRAANLERFSAAHDEVYDRAGKEAVRLWLKGGA
jgi:hypothetical protein